MDNTSTAKVLTEEAISTEEVDNGIKKIHQLKLIYNDLTSACSCQCVNDCTCDCDRKGL